MGKPSIIVKQPIGAVRTKNPALSTRYESIYLTIDTHGVAMVGTIATLWRIASGRVLS